MRVWDCRMRKNIVVKPFSAKSFWALWRRWSAPEQVDQPTYLPPSLRLDSNAVQPANTKAYATSDGVIFVCNIKKSEFITCWAVNYQNLRKKKPIRTFHENNVLPSKDEPPSQSLPTQRKPKNCLKTLGEDLDDFYRYRPSKKTANWAERNSKRLENCRAVS